MSVKHVLLVCAAVTLLTGGFIARSNDAPDLDRSATFTATPAGSRPMSNAAADGRQLGVPDVSALRYYARTNDLTRVAAEIRRLKAEFPTWSPPDDLYSAQVSSVDETPLWDLYAKRNFDGIEQMLADIKRRTPGWSPSSDFTSKYQHAHLVHDIVEKSNKADFGAVIALASSQDGVITCSDLDVSWRVAEAFAKTGNTDQALNVYRFILTNCNSDTDRLVTAQKALQVLTDPTAVDAIIGLGHKQAGGRSEFEGLRNSALRRGIGDFAAGQGTSVPDVSRVEAFETTVRATRDASDALLLGWYDRKLGKHDEALVWFKLALDSAPSPKAAQGLALTLGDLNRSDEAETLAYQWRDKSPDLRNLYITIVSASLSKANEAQPLTPNQTPAKQRTNGRLVASNNAFALVQTDASAPVGLTSADMDRLGRFKTEVEIARSALGAQSLGWTLFHCGGVETAAFWFKKSFEWNENEDAALGLVLAARQLNNSVAYKQLYARFAPIYPKVAELEQTPATRFASLLPSDVPSSAIGQSHGRPIAEAATGAQRRVHAQRKPGIAKPDTSTAWDADAQEIAKASDDGKYDDVIKRVDARLAKGNGKTNVGLEVIRGWALLKMTRADEAKAAFEAVKAQGDVKAANEGLRAVANVYIQPRFR